jgi:serine phosphatase RsbU (regulator of sigma subunit)
MFRTVQDITEGRKAEREHRIAETLQRSVLPDRLPGLPGVLLAARYVPASAVTEVGGDWYDVLDLDSGMVRLANAGHPPPLVVGPDGQTTYLEEGLVRSRRASSDCGPWRPAATRTSRRSAK